MRFAGRALCGIEALDSQQQLKLLRARFFTKPTPCCSMKPDISILP
jgi:hypothetical protein